MNRSSTWIVVDDGPGTLIEFDGLEEQTLEAVSEVSQFPIEDGSKISDHIIDQPITLPFKALVTNTPFAVAGSSGNGGAVQPLELDSGKPSVVQFPEERDWIQETYDKLLELRASKNTCTVVTARRTFDRCVLTRNALATVREGLGTFDLEFTQVKIVVTQTTNAPEPTEPRGAPGQSKGNQTPNVLDDTGEAAKKFVKGLLSTDQSTLAQGADWVGF